MPIREFAVPRGHLLQGGLDAAKPFYKEPGVTIVNVAPRAGEAKVKEGPPTVYWLPMQEATAEAMSKTYLAAYGPELLALLAAGRTIVVHCQEGVFRSVAFATQLQKLAKSWKGWDAAVAAASAEAEEATSAATSAATSSAHIAATSVAGSDAPGAPSSIGAQVGDLGKLENEAILEEDEENDEEDKDVASKEVEKLSL